MAPTLLQETFGMMQKHIDAYPQGLGLSVQQKQHLSTHENSTPAVHSVLVPIASDLSVSVINQRATEIAQQQLILQFAFVHIEGQDEIHQMPAEPATSVCETLDSAADLTAVERAKLIPVTLNAAQGHTIQLSHFEAQQQAYLLVHANALALDIASVYEYIDGLVHGTECDDEVIQYPDFLAWVTETNSAPEAAQGAAYWQQVGSKLQQLDKHFQLPYRKAPEVNDRQAQQSQTYTLDSSLLQRIDNLAEQLELDADVILQATWWLLLARISQNKGFVAGCGYDARQISEELEGALGVYQLHLPLAIEVNPTHTLSAWLTHFDFQNEQHVEWAESFAGLAEYGINTAPSCLMQVWHGEVQGQLLRLDDGSELHLMCVLQEDEAILTLRHDSRAYSADAVQALLAQYQHLLMQLDNQLHTPISALSIATEQEQQRHLGLNRPATDVPLLFDKITQFAQQNSVLALTDGQQSLDYAALDNRLLRIAQVLKSNGVVSNDIVTVALPRSFEQVLVILAIQRLGAAYCPVDPVWPEARQAQIISAAGASCHISEQGSDHALGLAALLSEAEQLTTVDSIALPNAQQAAYVLFTSGSTGTPKGVVIEHGQLAHYCFGSSEALNLGAERYGLTSTVAADIGNTCLFNAFYNGGSLIVAPEQAVREGQAFAQFVTAHQVEVVKIVPSHLQALLEAEPKALPQKLILGGEASAPTLLQKIHQLSPSTQVFNHYGPTEATVGVLSHQYHDLTSFAGTVAKLSKAFAGTSIYILNEQGALCAMGEQGELHIAGTQLARGYLGKGEHEGFITDSQWAPRLYPTGDVARYMPDGSISLSGRKDDQVQIRGFRVEPNDVAAAVSRCLTSVGCYVTAHKVAGQTALVAYLTGFNYQGEAALGLLTGDVNQYLQTSLREQLPEAMVPQFFVALEQLPLLANGKVDRSQLPDVAKLQTHHYVAPNSQLETWLADALANILEVDKVSCDASFFDLGGHSLAAIKLVTRIKQQLLMDVEPTLVFDNATIVKFAAALSAQHSNPQKLEKIAMTQLKLATLSPEQRKALQQKLGLGS
ncbi:AMP-binding protein [Pseudoalteromonas luteoviolacea]|uniref:amino acid adenylation domain-containing protein n=1 Tax=Pseudoalteromonas luteoviolacea TaxID=43657 RepID=UPI001F33F1D8|nr:amino acid adenylation domain-containing protein [Pseudoalteromonas luteoviolacea]MCF6441548.1 AMP-binding protein [Pseudoalteromonas luteoviolacea]